MNGTAPLGAEAREQAVRASLIRHPDALVAAINPEGLFVDMPASVPLDGHQVSHAGSALDLVPHADRPTIITTWEEARATGVGRGRVHLVSAPEQSATITFVDLREAHGVYLAILVAEGDPGALVEVARTVTRSRSRVGWVRKNEVAVFVDVDQATAEMLDRRAEELVGKRSLEFIHPDDQERAIDSWMEMLATPGTGPPVRLRHQRADGTWVWVEITNENRLDDPDHHDVLAQLVDISDEMAAHEELRARERLLDRIAEALPIGLFQADAQRRIVYTNEPLHEILGAARAATVDEQLATVLRDDWGSLDAAIDAALRGGTDADVEVQVQRAGRDRLRRCLARVRALTDDHGAPNGAIVCIEDVTESAQLRAELERRATYDMLTRCHNRNSVMAALEVALAQGEVATTAVVFVDVDRFKTVNDRLGHGAGDELLVVVADRLGAAIRRDDVLGRIGGDEFLVVCSRIRSTAEALEVGRRIADSLRDDIILGGTRVTLRASVGVACSDEHTRADELVDRADAAMYESKREGRGRAVLFGAPGREKTGVGP